MHKWASNHSSGASVRGSIGWTDMGICMPQPQLRIQEKDGNTLEANIAEDVACSGSASLRVAVNIKSSVSLPLFTFDMSGLKAGVELIVTFRVKSRTSNDFEVELMTTLPCHLKERDVHPEPHGWVRHEQRLSLSADSHGSSPASFGITLEAKVEEVMVDVAIGSYSIEGVAPASQTPSDDHRVVQADEIGHLSWDDFAPHAPFYEVFSETGAWLCTATREWGRTQAIVPRSELKGNMLIVKACE